MGSYMFDLLRVALSVVMFGYVAYKDVKTREVNDLVWIIFGVAGLGINAFEVYMGALDLGLLLVAVGFSVLFALAGGYTGLFGEADLLALIVITMLNPTAPIALFKPMLYTPILIPLTVITNSAILSVSGIIIILIYNIRTPKENALFEGYSGANSLKKIILLMTGMRKDLEKVRGPPFEYPLEAVNGEGVITLLLKPDFSDDANASNTFTLLRSMGRSRVWVAYSLPFLLMLALGYVSSIIFGDFGLYIMSLFIH
jgi:hypothetical protein